MAASVRSTKEDLTKPPFSSFKNLEDAAAFAETHDVGEPGPKAELPQPRGGSLTIHLPPQLLQALRREAIRRGGQDLEHVAIAVLSDALRDSVNG